MKRSFFAFLTAICPFALFAQGEMDALKMAQTDILGTARYMSMGGAFGALGGDASAIGVNPGGLGLYRKMEVALTPSVMVNKTSAENAAGVSDDKKGSFNINNFSMIVNFNNKGKVLKSSSFAFAYNRNTNFRRNFSSTLYGSSASITDYLAYATSSYGIEQKHLGRQYAFNGEVPLMADLAWQSYMIYPVTDDGECTEYRSLLGDDEAVNYHFSSHETGGINKFDFSYGANLKDIVFLGASLGVYNINYKLETKYLEDFAAGGYFDLYNRLRTTGAGIDFKVGAIVAPVDWVRIGASVHTPTLYFMEDKATFWADYNGGEEAVGSIEPVLSRTTYNYYTPYKVIGSLAFVIGKKGIISADYEMSDFAKLRFETDEDNYWYSRDDSYSFDNENIKKDFRKQHTIRVGGEYRVTDNFSVRLGYSYSTPPVKDKVEGENLEMLTAGTTTNYAIPTGNSYYSGGFGYRKGVFFVDLAYAMNVRKENHHLFFDPYAGRDGVAKLKMKRHFAVCTFGIRF